MARPYGFMKATTIGGRTFITHARPARASIPGGAESPRGSDGGPDDKRNPTNGDDER